ncbi:hypothetical protein [Streptomyces lydicus]|uniref:hypothetical protein n=1 Tax=Streptomyces lydicus TaxID=47763 RepID=UPI0037F4AC3E
MADLPGYPGNLSLGPDGAFWIALAEPSQAAPELLHTLPFAVRRPPRGREGARPEPREAAGDSPRPS